MADAVDAHAAFHVAARLGAADGGGCLTDVQRVECPGGFENDRRAVFHDDKAERAVLDRKLLGVPVSPRVALVCVAVEHMIGGADAVLRLVVVHNPERKVQRVRPDVNEGTAALLVFVEEHAPGGNGSSADGGCLCVIDVAEHAVFGFLLHVDRVGAEAALIPDGKQFTAALLRVQHFLRLGGVDCHRLFAHDVLSGVQRIHRDETVRAVGRQDMHDLDLRVGKQFLIVGVHLGFGRSVFFRRLFGSLPEDVAEGDHLHTFHLFQRRHVLAVCDAAASDDADLHRSLFHESSPFLIE